MRNKPMIILLIGIRLRLQRLAPAHRKRGHGVMSLRKAPLSTASITLPGINPRSWTCGRPQLMTGLLKNSTSATVSTSTQASRVILVAFMKD